ncbi:MAG: helix-hairpin-helix domain-containing protein, partial [Lentilactobacillus hilgardii]
NLHFFLPKTYIFKLPLTQAHGQFKSIEELKDVPGFGDKTFDNLKSTICV